MNSGEMWFVEIPSTNGHEQSGLRPVIVLSEVDADIVIIVPFTSNLQALRYPNTIEVQPSKENGLKTTSVALVFQIRAIDKKRMKEKTGNLEETQLKEVNRILKQILKI